jgi:hypothetical protein
MFIRVLGEVKEFRMKDRNLVVAGRRNSFLPTAQTNITQE